jgi:hypothetical protein
MGSRLGQDVSAAPGAGPRATSRFWPRSRLGWWSVGLTVAALAYWRTRWRFEVLTDWFGTWVGVAGAGALAGLAVIALVVATWRERERALLPFICLALILATVVFWLLFLGGERLFPH